MLLRRAAPFKSVYPTDEPLTVQQALDWLRLDLGVGAGGEALDPSSDPDGRVVLDLIRSARARVEELSGMQLMPATYVWRVSGFWSGPLRIPVRPFIELLSMKYYDGSGMEQTVSPADYVGMASGVGFGEVEVFLPVLPTVHAARAYPVEITFRAGFTGEIHPVALQAMRCYIGGWYDDRGDSVNERITTGDKLAFSLKWPEIA